MSLSARSCSPRDPIIARVPHDLPRPPGTPELTTMFSQLFLGTRRMRQCHHHPNERWSQDDFYRFAAFFGR